MKVEYKILAALVVAFGAILLVGTLTFINERMLIEHNRWVVHTYRVLSEINDVFGSADEIESGGRGYLLTGRTEYLQPYQSGVDNVGAELDEVQRLSADNPLQQQRVATARTAINRSIATLHRQIEQRRAGGFAAVTGADGIESKENMDQVRFDIAAMKHMEGDLLESRTASSEQSANHTLISFGLMLALAVLLLTAFSIFIWHDLVDRRRTDEALRHRDLKFRGLMDGAPDAMIITDDEGRIQIANSQAERLFAFPREEFVGRELTSLLLNRSSTQDEPGDDGKSARETDSAYRDFQTLGTKIDGIRKGGDLFPIDLTSSPLEVGGEKLVVTAIRDRTERENAEQALGKYSLDLARSNAELERFAYVASHDLQEPLRMVSSYTQLLSRRYKGKLDANADEFISYAVDGATRMQKLINDLLALSRVGTQAKPNEPVDTGAAFQRVVSDMKSTIEDAGAVIESPPDMPTVLGDGTQIGQVFQNLVGNALKFRGDAPPRLRVSVARTDNDLWRFEFNDNGIGIDPQYFERIFVIFQRLHGKENYPGTGIGLAICKKIVERHGGQLWVESKPGAGSTFCFTLPASQ